MGNGGKPNLHSHPFLDHDLDKQEIIVVNPSKRQLVEMRKRIYVDDEKAPDRSLLQVIHEDYRIDLNKQPKWPDTPVTVNILNTDWDDENPVKIIKKRILQPDFIRTAALTLKS